MICKFKWEYSYFGDKTSNVKCPFLEMTKICIGSISCQECKHFISLKNIKTHAELECYYDAGQD